MSDLDEVVHDIKLKLEELGTMTLIDLEQRGRSIDDPDMICQAERLVCGRLDSYVFDPISLELSRAVVRLALDARR